MILNENTTALILFSERNDDKEVLSETTEAAQAQTRPIVTVANFNEFGYRKQVLQRACSMLHAIMAQNRILSLSKNI